MKENPDPGSKVGGFWTMGSYCFGHQIKIVRLYKSKTGGVFGITMPGLKRPDCRIANEYSGISG